MADERLLLTAGANLAGTVKSTGKLFFNQNTVKPGSQKGPQRVANEQILLQPVRFMGDVMCYY